MLQNIASLVLLVTLICAEANAKSHYNLVELDELWTSFKKTYDKFYDDEIEDSYRRSILQNNLNYIQKHNIEADLGMHTYTLGVNEYADLTLDEYRKLLLGTRVPPFYNNTDSSNYIETYDEDWQSDSSVSDTVDWRAKGYVTPVKNQKSCGSCWAFSSTGSLEGQNFRKTGKLVSLSEQNLVDCSRAFGNQGCNGGWMSYAFNYVRSNNGIDTDSSYPYVGRDGTCRFTRSGVGAKCTGYKTIPAGNEVALQQAVATVGPISVAIDAGHASFQLYKSGVYNEPACTSRVNHAVLVVGYGTYGTNNYWLVKNSWGTSWGTNGYIMMSRNKRNQCAIASYGIYPTM
jgi:cathepsin L